MIKYTSPQIISSALITIDVQNDFTVDGAPARIDGTDKTIPKISRMLEAYRANGLPIFHMVRLYAPDGTNAELCRKEALEQGAQMAAPHTAGAELVEGLTPPSHDGLDADRLLAGASQQIGKREYILYKPRWGAFYRTQIESMLKDYECDSLVFCGCNYPNCPRASIYEASERDFRVALVTDAISQLYKKGEEELAGIGVHLVDTDDVLEKLAQQDAAPDRYSAGAP